MEYAKGCQACQNTRMDRSRISYTSESHSKSLAISGTIDYRKDSGSFFIHAYKIKKVLDRTRTALLSDPMNWHTVTESEQKAAQLGKLQRMSSITPFALFCPKGWEEERAQPARTRLYSTMPVWLIGGI